MRVNFWKNIGFDRFKNGIMLPPGDISRPILILEDYLLVKVGQETLKILVGP